MKKLIQSKPIQIAVLIALVLLMAGVVIPAAIKLFFIALLWFMQNPLLGLAITSAFLIGMFFSDIADRVDGGLNK